MGTFLAGVSEALGALHVVPLVLVADAECVHAVLISVQVVRLVIGPEPNFLRTSVDPGEHAFTGDVIQTDPARRSVLTVLDEDVFFLAADSHQIGVHASAL